ncbi:MAG: YjaG family protein [Succinivibrio sp.]|nr:YjaG family protein [Succinivibrio sp.]
MIFGEKFYDMLAKMSPWRQSLFALVLAQRQYPNYALWAEVENISGGIHAFNKTLDTLWEFHTDKFNTIDLEKVLDEFEPYMLDDEKNDLSVGDLFSLDATLSLSAAILAIILHEGEEAEMASRASLSGVVRKIEQESDREYSDEELREMQSVDDEVNFQVSLYELLEKSSRGEELVKKLKVLAFNNGLSNIGIAVEKD